MNPVRQIQKYNAGREPVRVQQKYRKMRENTFAFMRGSCHLFYSRLPRSELFRSVPPVWCCGDLHLENFGCYEGDNRLGYFDINDYDEAALAPATWDLVRLLCSLHVAADSDAFGPGQTPDSDALARTLIGAYGDSLAQGKAYWLERDTAQGPVKTLLQRLHVRRRGAFVDEQTRMSGRRRRLRIDGDKVLAASRVQRDQVKACLHDFAQEQPDPTFYRVLDVARRVAGIGSLGLDRYVVLVQGNAPDGHHLLDLKRSLPSSLTRHLETMQPRWPGEAQRIVAVQERMQAVPMALLRPVTMDGQPYVLRELQPSDDRIALDKLGRGGKQLEPFITSIGRLVAWAHLRSAGRQGSAITDELIDFGRRKRWQAKLLKAARACAGQVQRDAHTFNEAFDDGVFDA